MERIEIGDVLHKKLNRGDCVLWIEPYKYSEGFQTGIVNRLFLSSTGEVEIMSPIGYLQDVSLYSLVVKRDMTIKIEDTDAYKLIGERFSVSKMESFQALQSIIQQNPGLTGEQIKEKFWKEGMNDGREDSNDDSNSEFLQ